MLSERFPPGSYSLLGRAEWRPFPRADDRASWKGLPAGARESLLSLARTGAGVPWPELPVTLFLDYARTGNRERFQAPYFQRRSILSLLVVAECIEDTGTHLDRIAEGIWLLCEESSWCLPAHLTMQRAGSGLPDVAEPIVDLFAAETGALLAWTAYLLGGRLDAVSPLLLPRIWREVDTRIISPFLARDDFWWMGLTPGADPPNNWNPWVNANVLASCCLLSDDAHRRAEVVGKAMRSLDRFLDPYPRDGGCDEGPDYWSRAAASVFDCLDILESVSAGRIRLWDDAFVQELGRYILRVHIAGDAFVNFADASGLVHPPAGVVFDWGLRIADARMQGFGALLRSRHRQYRDTELISPQRLLRELFLAREMDGAPPAEPFLRDAWLPVVQVMTSRDRAGSSAGLFVGAKGGHNAESHNHNDVGSFVVYRDGMPLVVDAGVGVYTRATFNPAERYGIWTMQSAFHTLLPTVDGVMQAPGRAFAARDVACSLSEETAALVMDIATAWPESAGIVSWRRRIELQRGKAVTVLDEYSLRKAAGEMTLSFLTPCKPKPGTGGRIALAAIGLPGGRMAATGAVVMELPSEHRVRVERIELHDARLEPVWGAMLSRVVITLTRPPVSGRLRFTIG